MEGTVLSNDDEQKATIAEINKEPVTNPRELINQLIESMPYAQLAESEARISARKAAKFEAEVEQFVADTIERLQVLGMGEKELARRIKEKLGKRRPGRPRRSEAGNT